MANGTIDESVGTIGMQSNLSKLARGFGRCCSTLPVSTGQLTLTRMLRCRMHASYTLFGSACEAMQTQEKGMDISDRSMEIVRQKRTALRIWTELRCRWRWSALQRIFVYGELRKVAKPPYSSCKWRKSKLKLSLANDKLQRIHTMVKAVFVERATGDDRTFWRSVRAAASSQSCWCSDDCAAVSDGNVILPRSSAVMFSPVVTAWLLRSMPTTSASMWRPKRILCPPSWRRTLSHVPARASVPFASYFCQGCVEILRTMDVAVQSCA